MRSKITGLYLKGQMKLMDWKEHFLKEEKGASHGGNRCSNCNSYCCCYYI